MVVYGETEASELEANYLKEIGCIVIYVSKRPEHGKLVDTIPFIRIKDMEIHGEQAVTHVMIDGEKCVIHVVYISTDYVFPGKPGEAPYENDATPSPPNLYGQTKFDGEKVLCDGAFLLRASVAPMDLIPDLVINEGHIQVNSAMETNFSGVYAAGDCVGKPYQIAKAVGEGQIAALTAVSWLDQQY